jgi:hypothetical protein
VEITAELANALQIYVGQKMFLESTERMYYVKNIIFSADKQTTVLELEDEVALWSWTDAGNNFYQLVTPPMFIARLIAEVDAVPATEIYWDNNTAFLPRWQLLESSLLFRRLLRLNRTVDEIFPY